jgi:hypothetical protein
MSELVTNKITPSTGSSDTVTMGDASDTFNFPSGVTVTAHSGATVSGFGGGKVLQAVTVVKSDPTTSTSTSFATISGMSVAITPAATSSKILVICNFNACQAVGANNPAYRIVRDSTAVNVGDASSSRNRSGAKANSYNSNVQVTASIMFLDAPSSTSSLTYALQWSTVSGTMYFNQSETFSDSAHYDSMASNITLMEIGA